MPLHAWVCVCVCVCVLYWKVEVRGQEEAQKKSTLVIDTPECLAERCSVHLTVKKIHCNSLNQGRDHKSTVWECLILQRELNDESFERRALGFKNQSHPGSPLCHWVKNKQLVCHIPPSVLLYSFWNGMKVTDYDYLYQDFGGLQNHCRCSHKSKRCLLLGRKSMTNLDSILKSRDITLPTNVHLVKAMVFPVVMYGWESWTIKKAEHQRIDAFELWC